ncbi:Protein Njmu-R1 [Trichoplax sp. H2]|nr:Protein Njmu-R1 [Trichoplax sp. H2]|eukprot:RDD41240.1 Protein Njmu-R1 [Trichoplax sp. H2]
MAATASYALYMLDEENSSLTKLLTSLDDESESQLRQYVERQLKRLLSQSGFVITTQLRESSPTSMCYLSLLDSKEIACKTELDAYVKTLTASLANFDADSKILSEDTVNILELWYTECIHYINRCTKVFGKDLALLIHAALFNTSINVNISAETNDNRQLSTDIKRFLMAGSLTRLISNDNVQENLTKSSDTKELFNSKVLDLNIDESGYEFSSKDVNASCTKWTEIMLKDESSSSFALRQILEDMKLKTVQEMNLLKRIVTQAQRSYYDLFRAYKFLIKCGNADVIMKHLYNGLANDSDENIEDIITLLHEAYINREPCEL